MLKSGWIWLTIMVLLLPSTLGVTIHGSVYDFGLDLQKTAIVEINSSPQQKMVAKDGTYEFSVQKGTYVLSAHDAKDESSIEENINASADGTYVLDLILIPSIENEELLLQNDTELPTSEDINLMDESASIPWYVWVMLIAAIVYITYKISKRKVQKVVQTQIVKEVREVPISDELQKVLAIVEKQGGRATQKEIRQGLPFSEAKISLMIDELEGKGLVKRIKKGRGNIIVRE